MRLFLNFLSHPHLKIKTDNEYRTFSPPQQLPVTSSRRNIVLPLLPGHGPLQPLDLDRIPALLVVVVQDDGQHDGGGLDVELENENAFTDFLTKNKKFLALITKTSHWNCAKNFLWRSQNFPAHFAEMLIKDSQKYRSFGKIAAFSTDLQRYLQRGNKAMKNLPIYYF
jgi:hypothetical protein